MLRNLAKRYGRILEYGIANPKIEAKDLDATNEHSRNLASMFGNPVLVDEQGRGIGGLGFGPFFLVGLGEGASGLGGVVGWGGNEIEEEGPAQIGAELADYKTYLKMELRY